MNCREFVEFIMSYLEGQATQAERETFDEHIGDCPPCLAYLETYRETIAMGRQACVDPEGPVPDDVPEALVQAVLAARRA
jgi:anti-sigma factor RsiW